MGSEKYPYKGVLDTLANRQYSYGTNAWTDTTNTTYTIATAGSHLLLAVWSHRTDSQSQAQKASSESRPSISTTFCSRP